MRKISVSVALMLWAAPVLACPVCERNQPRLLKGITHGSGPDSRWDYVIVSATVLIALYALLFAVKWLIRPGEQSENHIKRFILNND